MTDKSPEPRVRAQRPDATAVPEVATKLDVQGHTTADVPPEDADTDGVVASSQISDTAENDEADVELPEAIAPEDLPEPDSEGTPNFRPPFSVLGNIVQDSNQRTVATVGAPHMTPDARHKAAAWLAAKLNV